MSRKLSCALFASGYALTATAFSFDCTINNSILSVGHGAAGASSLNSVVKKMGE